MYYLVNFPDDDVDEVHTKLSAFRTPDRKQLSTRARVEPGQPILAKWGPNNKWYPAVIQKVSSTPIHVPRERMIPRTARDKAKTQRRVEKLKTKAQAVAVKAALHDRQVALLASVVTASSSSSSSAPASASSSSSSSSPSQIAKTSRARAAPARSLVSVVTASSEERLAQMETKLKELENKLRAVDPREEGGVRRIAPAFSYVAPVAEYEWARGEATVGRACGRLLRYLWTEEDLKHGSEALDPDKVAALIAFCIDNEKKPLRADKRALTIGSSVRKYLTQKCCDVKAGKRCGPFT